MTNPRFTIIIPAYNGGPYLQECVRSVLAQTYRDFTLAVLDDCSTDGSVPWLESLGDAHVVVYKSGQRLGIVDNWARALHIPRGEFMTILGQDDRLDPNYLEVMDALIRREPDASLYHAHFRYIDEQCGVLRSCRPLPARETAAEYISGLFGGQRDTWGSGYMMRSADYDAVGGIPRHEKLLFADDMLWIKIMQRAYKAAAPEECFSIRRHSTSVGATASWQSWVKGMEHYVPFLAELQQRDPEVTAAIVAHAPAYFSGYCRLLYLMALVQATKKNECVDPGIPATLAAALSPLVDLPVAAIRTPRNVRAREFINKNPLARTLYLAYIRTRYGQDELAKAYEAEPSEPEAIEAQQRI